MSDNIQDVNTQAGQGSNAGERLLADTAGAPPPSHNWWSFSGAAQGILDGFSVVGHAVVDTAVATGHAIGNGVNTAVVAVENTAVAAGKEAVAVGQAIEKGVNTAVVAVENTAVAAGKEAVAVGQAIEKGVSTAVVAVENTAIAFGHRIETGVNEVEKAAASMAHTVQVGVCEAAAVVATKASNVADIVKTLAIGTAEEAGNFVKGAYHLAEAGVVGTVHGVENAASWVVHNPGKSLAIAGVVAAIAAAEIMSGGFATPAIVSGLSSLGTAIGSGVAWFGGTSAVLGGLGNVVLAYQIGKTSCDMTAHKELGILFNQENYGKDKVDQARKELKGDTGSLLFTAATIGAGKVIGKVFSVAGKATSAAEASETAVSGAATAEKAVSGVAASQKAVSAAATAEKAVSGVAASEKAVSGAAVVTKEVASAVTEAEKIVAKTMEDVAIGYVVFDDVAGGLVGFLNRMRDLANNPVVQGLKNANDLVNNVQDLQGIAQDINKRMHHNPDHDDVGTIAGTCSHKEQKDQKPQGGVH